MLTLIIIIGAILLILGLIGCIIPALPGPPLSFVAIILVLLYQGFEPPLTSNVVIILAVLTTAVTVLDYIIPAAGARKYGASKWGFWGSIVGMIFGVAFFPPWGIFLGAFLGAVFVEYLVGKKGKDAFRAGWGVFVGTILGTILKVAVSFVITYYFIVALI